MKVQIWALGFWSSGRNVTKCYQSDSVISFLCRDFQVFLHVKIPTKKGQCFEQVTLLAWRLTSLQGWVKTVCSIEKLHYCRPGFLALSVFIIFIWFFICLAFLFSRPPEWIRIVPSSWGTKLPQFQMRERQLVARKLRGKLVERRYTKIEVKKVFCTITNKHKL